MISQPAVGHGLRMPLGHNRTKSPRAPWTALPQHYHSTTTAPPQHTTALPRHYHTSVYCVRVLKYVQYSTVQSVHSTPYHHCTRTHQKPQHTRQTLFGECDCASVNHNNHNYNNNLNKVPLPAASTPSLPSSFHTSFSLILLQPHFPQLHHSSTPSLVNSIPSSLRLFVSTQQSF